MAEMTRLRRYRWPCWAERNRKDIVALDVIIDALEAGWKATSECSHSGVMHRPPIRPNGLTWANGAISAASAGHDTFRSAAASSRITHWRSTSLKASPMPTANTL